MTNDSIATTAALDRLVQVWRSLHPRSTEQRVVLWTAAELRQFCAWWLTLPEELQETARRQLVLTWQSGPNGPTEALSLAQVLAWLGFREPARVLRLLREWQTTTTEDNDVEGVA